MRKSPCIGCKDRCVDPNCHDNCPHGYKEWAEELAAAKQYVKDTTVLIGKHSFDVKGRKGDRAPKKRQ